MNRSVEQFLLLLASAPFDSLQIREIVHWIDVNGTSMLEEAIESLRGGAQQTKTLVEKNLLSTDASTDANSTKQHPEQVKPILLGNENTPAEQIEIILRVEAELKTTDASQLLLKEIHDQFGPILLPKLGKNSFKKWVGRLSKKVPYKLLFQYAMKIRDERVQNPCQDWPQLESSEQKLVEQGGNSPKSQA